MVCLPSHDRAAAHERKNRCRCPTRQGIIHASAHARAPLPCPRRDRRPRIHRPARRERHDAGGGPRGAREPLPARPRVAGALRGSRSHRGRRVRRRAARARHGARPRAGDEAAPPRDRLTALDPAAFPRRGADHRAAPASRNSACIRPRRAARRPPLVRHERGPGPHARRHLRRASRLGEPGGVHHDPVRVDVPPRGRRLRAPRADRRVRAQPRASSTAISSPRT